MGPHASACGNILTDLVSFLTDVLQWGRTLARAETNGRRGGNPLGSQASMGPHASACGNNYMVVDTGHGLVASMGPHASACGNAVREWRVIEVEPLQWGRTLARAETFLGDPLIEPQPPGFNGAAR